MDVEVQTMSGTGQGPIWIRESVKTASSHTEGEMQFPAVSSSNVSVNAT